MNLAMDLSGAGTSLRRAWDRLSPHPGGKRIFDRLLGLLNPYTGSVGPHFLELRPGYTRVAMLDRRAVRNHVSSVHAIALANLGEMSTGLAVMAGLPADARTILVQLNVEYLKKARGTITAECTCTPPTGNERKEVEATSEMRNERGELVARVRARWLVGPQPKPGARA